MLTSKSYGCSYNQVLHPEELEPHTICPTDGQIEWGTLVVESYAFPSRFLALRFPEERKVPAFTPVHDESFSLEFNRQPYITAIDGILGAPDIGDEDEGSRLALYGEHIGALTTEGEFGIRAFGRIAKRFPWS